MLSAFFSCVRSIIFEFIEVIAGKAFYNGTHAVVVSNAGFTKAAKSLAESADVILVSDTELEDLETMV